MKRCESVEAASVSSFIGISRGGFAGKGTRIVIWPDCGNGLRAPGIVARLSFSQPSARHVLRLRIALIVLDLLPIGEAGIAESRSRW